MALDLAGAEKLYPTKQFVGIFKEALAYNIPFTIHAGEADGEESIKTAIYMGAERIGPVSYTHLDVYKRQSSALLNIS